MLNAAVGVERVIGRLRRPQDPSSTIATPLEDRSPAFVRRLQERLSPAVVASNLFSTVEAHLPGRAVGWSSRSLVDRLGRDHLAAITVGAILIGASVVSVSAGAAAGRDGASDGARTAAAARTRVATGGTNGAGVAPRIAVGGGAHVDPVGDVVYGQPAFAPVQALAPVPAFNGSAVDVGAAGERTGGQSDTVGVEGPFLEDGTLLKPVAVNTTVADGRGLVRTYTVRDGDDLDKIAKQAGVSKETVWWANDLTSTDQIKAGKVLRIPPANGLIVTVAATDTLDELAARYKVKPEAILATNGLDDPNLVVGQVLVLPGAADKPIPTPTPTPTPEPTPSAPRGTDGTGTGVADNSKGPSRVVDATGAAGAAGVPVKPPASYTGGTFEWPVVGGKNYISQYFHYGHYAIDIAADSGSRVQAAGAGVVTFAGWKSNGGGYQVWIAHGSNLFTTYNHMSAITVGVGQQVDAGQQVGRVGQSGNATGPHLHFEVWRGAVWDGGQRLNPLGFLQK